MMGNQTKVRATDRSGRPVLLVKRGRLTYATGLETCRTGEMADRMSAPLLEVVIGQSIRSQFDHTVSLCCATSYATL